MSEREKEQIGATLGADLDDLFGAYGDALRSYRVRMVPREVGRVLSTGDGVAVSDGLPNVGAGEVVLFPHGVFGTVFTLERGEVSIILLGSGKDLGAGDEVRRTGRVLDVPVGDSLLGRVVNPLGVPLDDGGEPGGSERRPIERSAPGIMDRSPVTVPLQTGIQAVDALVPIGRGQRELVIGDRQTGKTALALDTMINQRDKGVICVYCAIGERGSAIARVIDDLKTHGVMERTVVVATTGEDPPGLKYIAPYSATTIAEWFMERGRDALVVYDDLTRHARTYRELSLLLRRPPAREAYPGDIFYIHARLLERSTHLSEEHGGGSLTALPIVETQAENISAYIPTNLVSITDGQIYLSPRLFQEGVLPAVDVGNSVSRVGGKTQFPSYRSVAGDLRLSYSQFEELETFARFGTRLDEQTQQAIERGKRVREILKQPRYDPMSVPEQIAVLLAVTEGYFDELPLEELADAKAKIRKSMVERLPETRARLERGSKLEAEDREAILDMVESVIRPEREAERHADA